MIEINLSPSEKQNNITNVAGINLSLINVRWVIPAVILIYTIESMIGLYFSPQVKQLDQKIKKNRQEVKELKAEERKYVDIKRQVEELDEQEKKLAAKIKVVREIIDKRQNPFNVLKYIADNTPDDVWIVELEISDRVLKMKGFSKSWKSIGKFIENLKNSIFFSGNTEYIKPQDLIGQIEKNRVEVFEITTSIVSFK
ncbi:MAG: PilN domain-containing protein [Bacteriovoracaceae bacterium]|jgi:Tfp pilus assembly protein PilN|nr:hypothetical protein [Halobacteriovoraceae bacterium]MDP7321304.1 PilN domain-containing protein [Bacteriovoracaceae bacterium]